MQRFDRWLTPNPFGVTVDSGPVLPGGVSVHESYGTTGASYSPEVGNPNGYFYPTVYVNDTDQSINVIAQGVALSMPQRAERRGMLSAYDALATLGRAMRPTSAGSR